MTEEIVLDPSVLVSAFVAGEPDRPVAREVMRRVFEGVYTALVSNVAGPEVVGAIARRAGGARGRRVRGQLMKWAQEGLLTYAELDHRRRGEAEALALDLGLRGMDAIITQLAKEKRAILITFDVEMARRAKRVVKVRTAADFPTG